MVKIDHHAGGGNRGLILSSVYLPYDGRNPPTRELEQLVAHCTQNEDQTFLGVMLTPIMKFGVVRTLIKEVSGSKNHCIPLNAHRNMEEQFNKLSIHPSCN